MDGGCSLIDPRTDELHPHTHIRTIQDGVTADEVAEIHGHQAVCDELRKQVHADRRPLSKVSLNVHRDLVWLDSLARHTIMYFIFLALLNSLPLLPPLTNLVHASYSMACM